MAVIIKGKSITCSQSSRDHYLRGEENERITVREVLGFATKSAEEALRMIELSVKGTKCKKPLYSVKLSPEPGKVWTKDEIQRAVELLGENLGLKDHPRVVVEHKKKGRVHYHVLWSRFHPDGGAAKNMGNDYAIHQKTQRQLEQEFKLRPMMARGRDFKQWEIEWAKRYGFDIFKLREQITADFNTGKSGQEFMGVLQDKGIVLCRGNKSQFVLILPWGQHKALSSMIYGRPTKAVLRRAFADIDIAKLPTVPEGKTQVKARLAEAKGKSLGNTGIKAATTHAASWRTAALRMTSHHVTSAPTNAQQMANEIIQRASVGTNLATAEKQPQQQQPAIPQRDAHAIQRGKPQRSNNTPQAEADGGDMPSGRAEAAYKEEFDKWQGAIEAVERNTTLSPTQRAANIAALRQQQHAAANGARQRVLEEEKSTARAARRARRILLGLPVQPS